MPPSGKRRLLTLYYMRIMAAYAVMWIPFVIMVFFVAGGYPWLSWFGGSWSHLQGPVSGVFVLMKPDVRAAYKKLMCCIDLKIAAGSSRFSLRSSDSLIVDEEIAQGDCCSSTHSIHLDDDSSSDEIVIKRDSNTNVDESLVEAEAPQAVSTAGVGRKEASNEEIVEDYADEFLPVQESDTCTLSDKKPGIDQGTFSSTSSS